MKTAREQLMGALPERLAELTILWNAYTDHNGQARTADGYVIGGDMDGEHIREFHLSFEYNSVRGYFRYQLSTGGPADEFRFYVDEHHGYNWTIDRVEYFFTQWYDGASWTLTGNNKELLLTIFDGLFVEDGSAQKALETAYNE